MHGLELVVRNESPSQACPAGLLIELREPRDNRAVAAEQSTERQPFAHLSAKNATLYRDVLLTFARARDRFIVHMRPEDIAAELGRHGDVEGIAGALEQLVEWGNLRADPDTSRVTSVADFHRARYLYQLTAAGQAAEEALAVYDEALGRCSPQPRRSTPRQRIRTRHG